MILIPLMRGCLCWAVAVLAVVLTSTSACAGDRMRKYPSRYYIIHTDLTDKDDIREAAVRMTVMAEVYHDRTRSFSGTIRKRLPFYLYSDPKDYHAAGAPAGSAGVFMGDKLMAIAGRKAGAMTWAVVQHEGFHQFVHHVIGGRMPPWADEGLAEYFEAGIFTGDDMVTGIIPAGRLMMLQRAIRADKTRSLAEVMSLDRRKWNHAVAGSPASAMLNYLQAWSIVHFLAHADDGKYRDALGAFVKDVSRGRDWKSAWKRRFRAGPDDMEKRWKQWWLHQKRNATAHLTAKATVSTMTSYLARGVSAGQKFRTPDELFKAIADGSLKIDMDQWLPIKLAQRRLPDARRLGAWSIENPGRADMKLVCKWNRGDGQAGTWVGTMKFAGRRVRGVSVDQRKGDDAGKGGAK
jgi:hypothetical protein